MAFPKGEGEMKVRSFGTRCELWRRETSYNVSWTRDRSCGHCVDPPSREIKELRTSWFKETRICFGSSEKLLSDTPGSICLSSHQGEVLVAFLQRLMCSTDRLRKRMECRSESRLHDFLVGF